MRHLYFLIFLCLSLCLPLSAQQQPPVCGTNPMMTSTCAAACIICDIDGFSGQNNSGSVGIAPPDFCAGAIHNIQWIGFIAGTPNITLEIAVSGCTNPDPAEQGLQIGLYESLDCNNMSQISNCDQQVPNNSTQSFVSNVPLTPGQYYYLVIDGAFADVCNYSVTVTDGSTLVPDIFVPSSITEEEVICPGEPTNFSATEVVGATDYEWTVDGALVGTSTNLTHTFPDDGGFFNVCVTASNICSTGPPSCTQVNLILPPVIPDFYEVCIGDCIDLYGETLCGSGGYEFTLQDQDGCDSLVSVIINPLLIDIADEETTICEGESIEFGGQTITEAGLYEETFTNQAGCDSTTFLTVNVTPAAATDEVAVICEGETYEVGDESFDETGMYNVLLPADDGECSEVVNLDLTVTPTQETFLNEEICGGTTFTVGTETFDATGMYQVPLTDAAGCDSLVNLELTVNALSQTNLVESICTGEMYSVGTENFNATGMYDVTLTDENGCDSLVNLDLTVVDVITENIAETICDGQSVTVGTETFTADGNYSVTLTSAGGCDSLVNLDLTVLNVLTEDLNEVICDGQSFTVGTETFDATGDYTINLTSQSGCDSLVNLDLEVLTFLTTEVEAMICEGESYTVGSESFDATGNYSVTLTAQSGCDSIVNLDLEVLTFLSTALTETICEGDTFEVGSESFNATGNYDVTLMSAAGCDSIVSLDLEVLQFLTTDLTEVICDGEGFTVGTETFNTDGNYEVTLPSSAGCDSIVSLDLTVVTALQTDLTEVICDGESFTVGSESFNADGDYSVSLTAVNGCDSIVDLNLTVLDFLQTDLVESICDGDSYTVGTETFNATGMYTVNLTAESGCDSIVDLDLTVLTSIVTDLNEVICAGESVTVGTETFTTAGDYSVPLTAVAGCDSLVNLNLTVNPTFSPALTEVICAGEIFTVGAEDFAATGDYTVNLITQNGCDSIVDLNLTVVEVIETNLVEFLCGDATFTVGSETFTETGDYQIELTAASGCDSLVNLALTVNESYEIDLVEQICSGEIFTVGTEDFNATGSYIVNLQTTAGCDSIVNLDLSVIDVLTENLTETICAGESFFVDTEEFTAAGDYSVSLTATGGCDSLVNLNLTVLQPQTESLNETLCEGEEITIGTQTFDASGNYVINLTSFAGCDSIVDLNLTVIAFAVEDVEMFICEGEEAEIGNEIFTAAGDYSIELTAASGCDSLVNLSLTVYELDEETIEETICGGESVFVDTQEFTAAGDYVIELLNENGCDSIVLLYLEVLPNEVFPLTAEVCAGETFTVGTETFDATGQYAVNLMTAAGCDSLVNLDLTVLTNEITDLAVDLCTGETFTLGNETFDATGDYEVILQNQAGCDSIVMLNLSVTACGIAADLQASGVTCFGGNDGSFTLSATEGNPPFIYTYSGNGQNGAGEIAGFGEVILTENLPAGNYAIVLTDDEGLEIDLTVAVESPAAVTVSASSINNVSCAAGSDGTAEVTASGGTGTLTYLWSNGVTGPFNNDLTAGSQTVTVTDINGCTETLTVELTEPDSLTFAVEQTELSCLNETGIISVTEVSGGTAPYVYSLNAEEATTTSVFTGLASGQYELTIEDANGCTATDTLNFPGVPPLFADLGATQTITLGDSLTLDPEPNFTPAAWVWEGAGISCDSCIVTNAMPTETTEYTFSAVNEEGCTVSTSLTVFVDKGYRVFLPTGFSPNNDENNDVFYVQGGDNVQTVLNLSVYTRWGEPVFQIFNASPDDEDFGWRGDHNGEMMNTGVYVWKAEILFTDGHTEVFSGDVTLLREE